MIVSVLVKFYRIINTHFKNNYDFLYYFEFCSKLGHIVTSSSNITYFYFKSTRVTSAGTTCIIHKPRSQFICHKNIANNIVITDQILYKHRTINVLTSIATGYPVYLVRNTNWTELNALTILEKLPNLILFRSLRNLHLLKLLGQECWTNVSTSIQAYT